MSKKRNKRSFSSPAIPISSPESLNYLGSRKSSSGVPVDRLSILSYPAVFRAISLVSGKIAKLPIGVYKKDKSGSRELDLEHDAHWLLAKRPSNLYTPFQFKRTLLAHALVHGMGYAWILRDSVTARPKELIILNPEYTGVGMSEGRLRYFTTIGQQEQRFIAAEDMLVCMGLSHDGLVGYSVLDILRESFGLGLAAQRYGSVYFANDSSPGPTILKLPPSMNDQTKINQLRDNWEKAHLGLNNSHRVAVLTGGADLVRTQIDNQMAQFLETRQHEIACGICNIFGVPPFKLGIPQATSYNSLGQSELAFLNDTLDIWLCGFEEECEAKLLRESQIIRDSHYIEFDRKSLEQADVEKHITTLIAELNGGLISENEARQAINLSPVNGADGDRLRMPVNLTFVDLAAAMGDKALSANDQPAEEPTAATDDSKEPVDYDPVDGVGLPVRYEKLKKAVQSRLDARLSKALSASIEKRTDIDIEGHIAVFVDSGLDYTRESAKAYIENFIRGAL